MATLHVYKHYIPVHKSADVKFYRPENVPFVRGFLFGSQFIVISKRYLFSDKIVYGWGI